jgi:SOS-response transcriptional repressor LexA
MLTARQSDLLRYLASWRDEGHGISPTYKQMQEALGLKSKAGIHRLIVSLEERGYIERIPNRARAIHVIAGPDGQPRRAVRAQDLIDLVGRLCVQEGPEVAIAALSDASARVAALFLSTEGNA